MPVITIQDASLQGVQATWHLEVQGEVSSLREVIRSRIYQEVSEFNAQQRMSLVGLVQSDQISEPVRLDWEEHYRQALQGFHDQRYLVLVDQRQIIELDKPLLLTEMTNLQFFQLFSPTNPGCCLSHW